DVGETSCPGGEIPREGRVDSAGEPDVGGAGTRAEKIRDTRRPLPEQARTAAERRGTLARGGAPGSAGRSGRAELAAAKSRLTHVHGRSAFARANPIQHRAA